jgi:hypothetical protein
VKGFLKPWIWGRKLFFGAARRIWQFVPIDVGIYLTEKKEFYG